MPLKFNPLTGKLDLVNTTGGGGGAVDSVNGKTGVVVLGADDIDDTATTNKFVTATDLTKLANTSGVNTGDQTLPTALTDLDTTVTGAQLNSLKTKVDGIEAGAEVNEVSSADIANFETTTQLNTRDTNNRNRANHTGTQAISTVTNLQSTLDDKLESGDIANFETSTQLNTRDTNNRARANHTGTQAIATVDNLQETLDEKVDNVDKYELIAHRGFANVNVENTVSALQTALTQGADSIEFDIQTSSDGTPYVFHDAAVDSKTNGSGTFTNLSDSTINGLRLTIADGTPLEGIKIPRLVDVIDAVKERRFTTLYPEVKDYGSVSDIETMVDVIKDAGLSKQTMWQSSTFSDLEEVQAHDNECEVGFLMPEGSNTQADMESAIDNIANNLERGSLLADFNLWLDNPSVVEYARNAGVGVGTWTVLKKEDVLTLLDIGVRRIMTDYNLRGVL